MALKLIALTQAGGSATAGDLNVSTPLPRLGAYTEQALAAGLGVAADQWSAYQSLWQTASKGQGVCVCVCVCV